MSSRVRTLIDWRPACDVARGLALFVGALAGLGLLGKLRAPEPDLLQVAGFGKTDYRRAAEAAVVFGARAYADGRPTDALADRVRTACQLYQQGWVRHGSTTRGPSSARADFTC